MEASAVKAKQALRPGSQQLRTSSNYRKWVIRSFQELFSLAAQPFTSPSLESSALVGRQPSISARRVESART